jgi:ATP-dependent protease ClpP protease subunit
MSDVGPSLIDLCEVIERKEEGSVELGADTEPQSLCFYKVLNGKIILTYIGVISGKLRYAKDQIEHELIKLMKADNVVHITIHLTSTGGDSEIAREFVDYMKRLQKTKVAHFTIIVSTLCYSAASYILAAADCAMMFRDTHYLIHSNIIGNNMDESKKLTDSYNSMFSKVYSRRGKFSRLDFFNLLSDKTKDFIFTAESALTAGLIDSIL